MADAISTLQQVSFDGLPEVPCQFVGLDWAHSLPARQYPYVNGDGHDWTGRRSSTIQVKLFFLNSLTLEQPGIQLFPGVFSQWLERLFDGSAGNLTHPVRGNIRARVMGGSAPLTSEVRAGAIVDVTFVETLDDPEQQIPFVGPQSSVEASALAAQAACDAVGVEYPDGELDAPDLITAVRQVLGEIDSTATEAEGRISQLQGAVVRMLDDAEHLNDHNAYAAVDNLTTLWASLQQLKEHLPVKLQRAVGDGIAAANVTLDRLARQHGNDLQDLMNLNPTLLRLPVVPKGARYRYFRDGTDAKASFVRS